MSGPLTLDLVDGVATVTIDHPPINLFDLQLYPAMVTMADRLASDPAVRVVVLRHVLILMLQFLLYFLKKKHESSFLHLHRLHLTKTGKTYMVMFFLHLTKCFHFLFFQILFRLLF